MTGFLFVVFLIVLAFGAPIAVSFGLSAVFGISVFKLSNLITMGQRFFEGTNSFALLAVPLFTFAGFLMSGGGIGRRLISFAYSLVGHIVGGIAHVNVVTSMIFAGISGSSAADAAFESALLMPEMIKKKYSREFTVAVTAISSTIGIIIPPSIPMVIIAGILGISTGKLFVGGIIPGILCGFAQMVVSYFQAKKDGVPKEEGGFEFKNVWKAFKESFLALLMPPLIVVSIMSGVVSPTEVALVTVIYALIVGKLVYHELDWGSFKTALISTVKTSSKIFLIIGVASVFGKLLTVGGFDKLVASTLLSLTDSPTVILLIILGILFIMGMFMETISIIVLFMPIIYPVALQVGIDPIHLSVLAVIVLGIGLVTPPEGMCLFICCDFLKVRIWDAMIALIPFIIVMLLVVGILILFPQLVLWPASFVG
ncbi:MAG: TRAP transporter large permease [Treponema sp.]|jgi:tripartite ATP-independent transporter DctM subunit|nr:TRAP transporter large permease [Treponema sp.]